MAEAARESPTELSRGAAWGRYLVLERVGQGTMGVVYAAYDPRLDRRVALKVLLPGAGASPEDRARLLREAQAMARLSHPNVVAVHDVSETEGELHIAMEYVDGLTLRQWGAERSRSWREVLAVFAQAGRGLAAAHAAGIVHRDFKPENVLVDRDGRVRVTDFGLARPSGAGGGPAQVKGAMPGATLTATGALHGTPGYMAPEQFTGRRTDPRTDQFGFCVALYEALYGERPFAGETLESLVFAVTMGRLQPAPSASRVPPWLRQVLLRGLAPDPDARFPSMEALLLALARDPAAQRRRWTGVALLALVAVASGAIATSVLRHADPVCRGGEARLAGVWDRARSDAVRRAFLGTSLPYAEEAWRHAEAALDRYAAEWVGMYRDACEATELRREQSEALLDLRMACLERRRGELAALAGLLAGADRKVVESAAPAVAAQTPLSTCADAAALTSRGRLPAEPELRRSVEALQADLARVKALTDSGKLLEALPEAQHVAQTARALGHAASLAEALVALALVHQRLEQPEPAEAALHEAIPAALESHHEEMLATALVRLIFVAVAQSRPQEAVRWGQYARGAVAALGPGHEQLEASRLSNMSVLAGAQGDNAEATRLDEAALALRERALGPNHLDTAASLHNLAADRYLAGDYGRAAELFRRAAEVLERAGGPAHPLVAGSLNGEGAALMDSGSPEEALRLFVRAHAIAEAALGSEQVLVADVLTNQATALMRLGRAAEAQATQERALEVYERTLGPRAAYVATALNNLADIHLGRGEHARAVELARRASALFADLLGPKDASVAEPLLVEAKAWLAAGKPERALVPAERATAIRDAAEVSPREKADARFTLARSLAALNRDRPHARSLAHSALDLFHQQGKGYEAASLEVEAWLADPAGPVGRGAVRPGPAP
jgi:eukaryotic-like serine/threonine-protein kinase